MGHGFGKNGEIDLPNRKALEPEEMRIGEGQGGAHLYIVRYLAVIRGLVEPRDLDL